MLEFWCYRDQMYAIIQHENVFWRSTYWCSFRIPLWMWNNQRLLHVHFGQFPIQVQLEHTYSLIHICHIMDILCWSGTHYCQQFKNCHLLKCSTFWSETHDMCTVPEKTAHILVISEEKFSSFYALYEICIMCPLEWSAIADAKFARSEVIECYRCM